MGGLFAWIGGHLGEALGIATFICGAIYAAFRTHFGFKHEMADHRRRLEELEDWAVEHRREIAPLSEEYKAIKAQVNAMVDKLEDLKDSSESDRNDLARAIERMHDEIMEEIIRLRGRYHEVEAVGKRLDQFQDSLLGRVQQLVDGVSAEVRRIISTIPVTEKP